MVAGRFNARSKYSHACRLRRGATVESYAADTPCFRGGQMSLRDTRLFCRWQPGHECPGYHHAVAPRPKQRKAVGGMGADLDFQMSRRTNTPTDCAWHQSQFLFRAFPWLTRAGGLGAPAPLRETRPGYRARRNNGIKPFHVQSREGGVENQEIAVGDLKPCPKLQRRKGVSPPDRLRAAWHLAKAPLT